MVGAQQFFKVTSVPVLKNGVYQSLAWEGGLNAPQFSEIDLDFDGSKELFLFDRSNNHITLLKRNGSDGFLSFIPEKNYFPTGLNSWVLLRDANCDGKEDIFTYGNQGNVAVYLNTSNVQNGIQFSSNPVILKAFFSYSGGDFTTEIYVGNSDLPSITDIDNDGDLDLLTFAFAGTTIEYYKNLSIERTGLCGLDFELKNGCWGYFEEGFATNDILLGQKTCDNQVKNAEKSGLKHSGSTLLHLDLDGDNIQDVLLGDISFQNIVKVSISKSSKGGDSAVAQDPGFPSNTEKVDIPIFPGTAYLDLTNDGIKDLVAFPNNPNSIQNYNGIWLYANSGTNSNPVFTLSRKGFLQNEMLDIGENTSACTVDMDNDGLQDLIISSRGKSEGDGNYASTLSYYRNNGSGSAPSFEWITDDLGSISQMGLGTGLRPTFKDLDADGKVDLILGNFNGSLSWIKFNPGNLSSFVLHQSSIKDDSGNTIDVGDYSHPCFADLNKDGKPDLIIGERGGNLNYYQNTGALTSPVFRRITDSLGHVSANLFPGDFGFSTPQIIENNGNSELIMGTKSGKIKRYAINSPATDFILSDTMIGGIYEGEKIIPFSTDLNGDGLYDLLLGNHGGGIELYYQRNPTTINKTIANSVKVFPNPANDRIVVETSNSIGEILIYDLQGRKLIEANAEGREVEISTVGLPKGLYVLQLIREDQLSTVKFQISR